MPKNLIARNYKHFTFDLVLWHDWKFRAAMKRWKFFNNQTQHDRTIHVRWGFFAVTVWLKSRESILLNVKTETRLHGQQVQ